MATACSIRDDYTHVIILNRVPTVKKSSQVYEKENLIGTWRIPFDYKEALFPR